MDPLTLLTVGPTVLRMVGNLFGGKAKEAADSVAEVVDTVKGLPAEVARAKVAEHIASMPPELQVQLKTLEVKLAEIHKEQEANRLQAETAQHGETQATARVEAQSPDEYVRRTRPKLARHSAYITFAYALITGVVFQVGNAIWPTANLPGPQEWIILALFAPCLSYMGARTADAIWSRKGKT